ncbi:uncharacterized protein LOC124915784 [Impatiens glandulifera]|uniref:uncharacterized protein LOC124915784 n=1 Tax=Impatiens glandulifera TaxID=253017 RepID=UPI001FB18737|nr:uncharacterized protein LOC124915784 [Impatiens glandulifera]
MADVHLWKEEENGKIKSSAIWNVIRERGQLVGWASLIWSSKVIPRHRFILCLVFRRRLNTCDRILVYMDIPDPSCVLCSGSLETIDHLFGGCPFARSIWKLFSSAMGIGSFSESWDEIIITAHTFAKEHQLTYTNYINWVIRVQTMMEDQGVWEAVESVEGTEIDVRLDKKARSHLLQALPEDLLMQVANKKTAKEFYNLETLTFEEAVGRLKVFEERTRKKNTNFGGNEGQVLLTQEEWKAQLKKDKEDSLNQWKKDSIDSGNRGQGGRT